MSVTWFLPGYLASLASPIWHIARQLLGGTALAPTLQQHILSCGGEAGGRREGQ